MSDDSEDDYVEFGTPLDPLDEEDCPRKKPFTIEEQFARDRHGRRRFHGAFTGGFSAGFLNTVGSLEGWQPSSFKSSKSEKSAVVIQQPEHFMDEEDLGEFGIAPSILQAKDDFTNAGNKKRNHSDMTSSSGFGMSVIKNLLQPVRETIGIKLLRKMGWKPGQGIGPRVSKQEKERLSKLRKKVYGCSLPETKVESESDFDEEDEFDGDELENITFAPKDYPFQLVAAKDNVFGIGYKGLEKRLILSAPQRSQEFQVRSKHTITGQAFGVGAFEEEDEDIYSREDMSQYDFTLSDATGKESASGHVTGEDLFDAFALALKKTLKKSFPPPALPKDFKPVHRIRVSRFEPAPVPEPSRKLSPSPERKVDVDEHREIQKEALKLTEPLTDSSYSRPGTFRPFVADADKQRRYEKYLKLVAVGKKESLSSLQPITLTEWERERERIEFEQAAKLFKPLSGVMEDRFTVASQPDDLNDPLAKVERLKTGSEDEVKAAKMKMYGPLTRKTDNWKPSSLLCKRFNIPELSTNEIPIVKQQKPKYSIFDDVSFLEFDSKRDDSPEAVRDETEDHKSEVKAVPALEAPAPSSTESAELQSFAHGKSKVDLFNAIFLDTDSEEEEEKEKKMSMGERGREFETTYEETITNEKRNTSPARGIFENLDYGLLLGTKKPLETEKKEKETEAPVVRASVREEVDSDLLYGPKLPDKLGPVCVVEKSMRTETTTTSTVTDDECWVEKKERREHKKEKRKKEKKSKKSKHKSKHKHKKSKR